MSKAAVQKDSSANVSTAPAAAASPAPAKEGGGSHHPKATSQGPKMGNVVSLPGMCMAEDCKKKSEKANFCMEHFDWFKEGLITKEGRKPSDFEKKHFHYSQRKAVRKVA
jgi:hypothetical protein